MTQKTFVTGAAGFIGSHVVDALIADGLEVTAFDNLSTGRARWLEPHLNNPRFRFIKGDLLDLPSLTEAVKGHDAVWHLGANTDIPGGISNTELDLKNCIVATNNLLEAMRRTGVKKMLFASSGSIYGEMDGRPRSETYGPILPLSLYASGKLACEGIISAFCSLFDLQAWIFRFGNVIGARMGHGVIYDFIQKLKKNPRELVVLGNGEQEKNYFLVEDCIDGMRYVSAHANIRCDVFNLGASSTTTVKRIAEIVTEEMGLKGIPIQYTGGASGWKGDQPKVFMSVEKVTSLGWKAKRSSDDAVRIAAQRLAKSV